MKRLDSKLDKILHQNLSDQNLSQDVSHNRLHQKGEEHLSQTEQDLVVEDRSMQEKVVATEEMTDYEKFYGNATHKTIKEEFVVENAGFVSSDTKGIEQVSDTTFDRFVQLGAA